MVPIGHWPWAAWTRHWATVRGIGLLQPLTTNRDGMMVRRSPDKHFLLLPSLKFKLGTRPWLPSFDLHPMSLPNWSLMHSVKCSILSHISLVEVLGPDLTGDLLSMACWNNLASSSPSLWHTDRRSMLNSTLYLLRNIICGVEALVCTLVSYASANVSAIFLILSFPPVQNQHLVLLHHLQYLLQVISFICPYYYFTSCPGSTTTPNYKNHAPKSTFSKQDRLTPENWYFTS